MPLAAVSWLALAPGSAAGPGEATGGTSVSRRSRPTPTRSIDTRSSSSGSRARSSWSSSRCSPWPSSGSAGAPATTTPSRRRSTAAIQVEVAWTVDPGSHRDRPRAWRPPARSSRSRTGRSPPARSRSPSSAISGGGSSAIPRSESSRPTSCTFRSATLRTRADVPDAPVGRRGPQLLGSAPGRQDRPDPEPRQHMWIEPATQGLYLGQCAEYCGTQHAKMLLRVVRPHAGGVRALGCGAAPAGGAGRERPPRAGRSSRPRPASTATRCAGTVANGRFGPDLTHLMSRDTIAAGVAPEHARESAALDPRPGRHQARRPHAGDAARRRASWTRSSRYLRDAALDGSDDRRWRD